MQFSSADDRRIPHGDRLRRRSVRSVVRCLFRLVGCHLRRRPLPAAMRQGPPGVRLELRRRRLRSRLRGGELRRLLQRRGLHVPRKWMPRLSERGALRHLYAHGLLPGGGQCLQRARIIVHPALGRWRVLFRGQRLRQCRRLVLAISGRHGRSLRGRRDGTLLRRRLRVHVLDRNCLRGLRGFRLAHVSGGLRFDRCGMPFSLPEQRFLQPRGRPVRVHARLQRRHHVRALPLLRRLARRESLHDRQRLPGRQLSERWMLSERRRKPLHRRRAMRQ
jgi:hypothetical protein